MRILLLVSLFLLFYSYVAYPLLLAILAGIKKREPSQPHHPEAWPSISLLVSAYNEEAVIEEKIRNSLALDYPKEKLEILIVADGCSDSTGQIVRNYATQGVQLVEFKERVGKAFVLSRTVPLARGEIIVLSDANTLFKKDVLRLFSKHFTKEQNIGVVAGNLELIDRNDGALERRYFGYDKTLKILENSLGNLVGAHGGCYAIRKEAFISIPKDTLIDDFLIAMRIQSRGYKGVYDKEIQGWEEAPLCFQAEYARRVRIGAGGYQALFLLRDILFPQNRSLWKLSFAFWSHKVLRWLGPFLLVFIFFGTLSLLEDPVFSWLGMAQTLFYFVALVGFFASLGRQRRLRWLWLPPWYFVGINLALLHGFFRYVLRRQPVTWKRTKRYSPELVQA